ncbi:hypothetical protein PoB_007593200 [Plakobranchus ocellatus]|uniref:Uncharacterized protein n=1 Tax=Plakobranchus ocellatus TaxID=259542 RepID=A0AAV4DYJ9_9GAST|nr:hypothetical protein PoB_007593200 [Plakobranchus ocellatus]
MAQKSNSGVHKTTLRQLARRATPEPAVYNKGVGRGWEREGREKKGPRDLFPPWPPPQADGFQWTGTLRPFFYSQRLFSPRPGSSRLRSNGSITASSAFLHHRCFLITVNHPALRISDSPVRVSTLEFLVLPQDLLDYYLLMPKSFSVR